ncbi:MAG: prepilin-type N-terminal cleavage/methylation domain-containing protein [Candidatus Sumerlaeia bacterium]|nr:prepilin-type N-terminal cleavage/methylation domain-containing protein [Candidatus Sumerlaeia bacterium]
MIPRAFTLIELLITVAIIAILAAIAVPNFLEAQTRSKVSRVKSDLRTLATAVEAYSVDFNRPPYDGEPGFAHYGWVEAQKQLTTPVAFLTSLPTDAFQDRLAPPAPRAGHTNEIGNRHVYDYSTRRWEDVDGTGAQRDGWLRNMGNSAWKLTSAGPDLRFDNAGSFYGFRELYDPTNGTISDGDIVRSQANVESK